MSILNPQAEQVDAAARIADQLKRQARTTYQQLVTAFNSGSQAFWRNPSVTPAQIAAALGTDAREVFELHGKIGALLASVKPEAIAPGAAVVGTFAYGADGTVIIQGPA